MHTYIHEYMNTYIQTYIHASHTQIWMHDDTHHLHVCACSQLQGTSVSRRHAQLSQEKEGWVLSDSSSNGTFVNGERVEGEVLVR